MKKLYLTAMAACMAASQAVAGIHTPPPYTLNDADAFVVARSFKLGDEDSNVRPANTHIDSNTAQKCIGDNCDEVKHCANDSQCDKDQYCAKVSSGASSGVCKVLCESGKTRDGTKCANEATTPLCGYDDNHQSHCSCTPDSCSPAYKCNLKSETYYDCDVCSADDSDPACHCPDGKLPNGSGECVTCNYDSTCAWDEYCANAGTTSS